MDGDEGKDGARDENREDENREDENREDENREDENREDENREDEDGRLGVMAPDIVRISMTLLRRVVGAYPEERIPQEAMAVSDEVLEKYGTEGLRILVMCLTAYAAVEIERNAQMSGRTLESLLDEMDLTRFEIDYGE
ncbi:hypothetical protein ABZV31_09020 [Streptomyces sp. NPDC005202]|uniref:hypothetical protein n=1 Tax=Streptomyces sp. NPDC005202 TaxID=3157021 RepID=UPI0033B63C3A